MDSLSIKDPPRFIFVVCQKASQSICKQELLQNHPELRFAFSRHGLMTFKLPDDGSYSFDRPLYLRSTFARTFGYSIGRIDGPLADASQQVSDLLQNSKSRLIHTWRRREQDFEFSDLKAVPNPIQTAIRAIADGIRINRTAKHDERVLDLIEVDDDNWLVGFHLASFTFQRWPGGKPNIAPESDVISRAWFKTRESVLWSQMPIRAGDECAEIGAAPGGCSQALLEMGCQVLAIDPADLDERIAAAKQLRHLKRRGREVKKSEFAKTRWLFADLNVAPSYTLDTIEDIVTHANVHVLGMILTLKMMDGISLDQLQASLNRVKGLGFRYVKTRQLAYNRQEICLMALKQKAVRRASAIGKRKRDGKSVIAETEESESA